MPDTATITTLDPWLHPTGRRRAAASLGASYPCSRSARGCLGGRCRHVPPVAHRMGDPVVELLVGMIVEDEQRHDALLRSMIRRLRRKWIRGFARGAVPCQAGRC